METVDPRKPDTTHIRTDAIFLPVAEPLEDSLAVICRQLGVEFRTVEQHGIFEVRDMILALFEKRDISHFHHLQNVGVLIADLLQSGDFRQFLEGEKSLLAQNENFKREEIDYLLSEQAREELPLAMNMHDLGKINEDVQKVINMRGRAPTKDENIMIQRHTASERLFAEIGITREHYAYVILTALFHHFPEYAGGDPRQEPAFHIRDPEMKLEKRELYPYTPLMVSVAKIIDIIEAMTSQIRSYREPCVIRWFEKDTGDEFVRRDGQLHTSIEGELQKKCPENPELSLITLKIIHKRWEDRGEIKGLASQLIRTREQLRQRGEEQAFDNLIVKHNPSVSLPKPMEYSSGRFPKIA